MSAQDDNWTAGKERPPQLPKVDKPGVNWNVSRRNPWRKCVMATLDWTLAEWRDIVDEGLPAPFAAASLVQTGLSLRTFSDLLGLSRSTLSRKLQSTGDRLGASDTEAILMLFLLLALVMSHAPEGTASDQASIERALAWLARPHSNLGQQPPSAYMRFAMGREKVASLLKADLAHRRL